MVVFGQKWLYSGKSGCIRAKVAVMAKPVVFVQSNCIRAKLVVLDKSAFFWVKVVVFGAKVVVFGQKWLYPGKSGCVREKVVVFG